MKKALVTGASGGIGEGHRYLLADLSNKKQVEAVMKDVAEQQ